MFSTHWKKPHESVAHVRYDLPFVALSVSTIFFAAGAPQSQGGFELYDVLETVAGAGARIGGAGGSGTGNVVAFHSSLTCIGAVCGRLRAAAGAPPRARDAAVPRRDGAARAGGIGASERHTTRQNNFSN